jgi:imidazolonepropionase-like amidohydrolase
MVWEGADMNAISRLVLALAVVCAGPALAQITVLTKATVIDGTGAPPRKDTTIVMENGRIRDMGPSSAIKPPGGATIVDVRDKYVVPGIINAHGHVGARTEPQLRQYALYGVTTTNSMQTDPDEVIQVRDAQRRGELRGSRVFTIRHRFAPDSNLKTPEEARAKVDQTVAEGADFIKLWIESQYGKIAKLPPEISIAVLEQSRKHGKITTAHIFDYEDAKLLIENGLNVMAHNVRDREVDAAFIDLVKRRNVTLIPTMTRDQGLFIYGEMPSWLQDVYMLKVIPADRQAVLKEKVTAQQAGHPLRNRFKSDYEMNRINLKKMADAGVRVAFGTDSGGDPNRFFVQGYFEHREMELMVDAGLTPMQVIQSFSKNASEALGIDKDFGTLAKGKAADLLVLQKNPLENIGNMRTIEAVYLGGRKFE